MDSPEASSLLGLQDISGQVDRRTVVRAGLGLALRTGLRFSAGSAGVLGLDEGVGRWLTRNDHASVVDPTPDTLATPYGTTVVIPGFNCDYSEDIARAIQTIAGDQTDVVALQYDNNGLDLATHARHIANYLKEQQFDPQHKLGLYGHSMGGLVALKLVPHLLDRNVSVDHIFLDCTPYDANDARKSPLVVQTGEKASRAGLRLGPFTRFLVETSNAYFSDGEPLSVSINNGCRKITETDVPQNKVIVDQMAILTEGITADEIQKVGEQITPLTYLLPDNPEQDQTVWTVQAAERFRRTFNWLQQRVIPGGGHANPNETPTGAKPPYAAVIRQVLHEQGFTTRNQTELNRRALLRLLQPPQR